MQPIDPPNLATAADREPQAAQAETEPSRASTFAQRWQGKFKLPEFEPDDPRLDYLLRKYWRDRE